MSAVDASFDFRRELVVAKVEVNKFLILAGQKYDDFII